MVGKQCFWGGWPSSRTLERHGGLTRGRHVLPIFTPPSTLSVRALCGSLRGFGSSLRLVLSPSLHFYLYLAVLHTILSWKLPSCICHVASNLWLVLFFVAMGGYVWPYKPRHRASSKGFSLSEGPPCWVDFWWGKFKSSSFSRFFMHFP